MRRSRARGCPRCARLVREQRRLRKRITRLEGLLEEARRSAKRQAAPFSRGDPARRPRPPGRRPGAAYGRPVHRPVPAHVDEVLEALLPHACPVCGGAVEVQGMADQYQTEVPVVRPTVVRFRIPLGRCQRCGHRVQGRHPRQTSNALGAAASHLGPRVIALAADLNKGLGLPYGKVQAIFDRHFGIAVSRGGLCLALHRLARRGQPTYNQLVAVVRSSPVVSPDETGWKVGGRLNWLWAFATPTATVYAILPGRGYEEAAGILAPTFAGTLVRDGWAPYRKFTQAQHQSCLAHLLRRCREMIEVAERGAARFPHAVRRLLLAALEVRERAARGDISARGLRVAKGQLQARLSRLLGGRIMHPPNQTFVKHLRHEAPHLLTFLGRDEVPATNFRAEQALRPAVVTRKVWGGNRTWQGAQTQQVLASILRTWRQRGQDPTPFFQGVLCSPARQRCGLAPPGPGPPRPPTAAPAGLYSSSGQREEEGHGLGCEGAVDRLGHGAIHQTA